jgi:hypothetical protein
MELRGAKLDKKLTKLFLNFQTVGFEAQDKALDAFLSGDIGVAESVRNMRLKVEKESGDIEELARSQSLDFVPQILAVASFLRQIYEHSVDISDLAVPKKD